ncbi:MAG: hypothetical protein GQ541_01220 [Desulfovibrionaceae bacterium]|nr:hypothetical protein [Desulfovibrionaceae bacterium]
MTLNKGLDRSIGSGDGKASATLHPHPILVRQHRACSKEIFISGSSIGPTWPTQV